jgi:hypothetical protein
VLGGRPPEMAESELSGFARAHHVAFFDVMSTELPGDYASQEVNHLTLAYFAVAGLSILRELDRVRPRVLLLLVELHAGLFIFCPHRRSARRSAKLDLDCLLGTPVWFVCLHDHPYEKNIDLRSHRSVRLRIRDL